MINFIFSLAVLHIIAGASLIREFGGIAKADPHLHDGDLLIDNNQAKNRVRPIALGRQNCLSADNLHAGKLRVVWCVPLKDLTCLLLASG
ncbi:IS66 family transposase [Variovorax boronicumulans]|uniref:IS66 family transposase n=1 Tax=Variovorax boronicumulans TaxID=436515 RepID=UPI0027D87F6C|nr:transposase [Variovorax boronicumulans]